jgi:hypothetical protein
MHPRELPSGRLSDHYQFRECHLDLSGVVTHCFADEKITGPNIMREIMAVADPNEVYEVAAAELFTRYRGSALDVAKDRVEQFAGAGDWTRHRQSLMVLSALERLIDHQS